MNQQNLDCHTFEKAELIYFNDISYIIGNSRKQKSNLLT